MAWPWGLGGQTTALGSSAGSPSTSVGHSGGRTPGSANDLGLTGQDAILQLAFLTQLISAVMAGVTPFVRAAAQQSGASSEQRTSGDGGGSGASKGVASTPCLPWGSACGGPKGEWQELPATLLDLLVMWLCLWGNTFHRQQGIRFLEVSTLISFLFFIAKLKRQGPS